LEPHTYNKVIYSNQMLLKDKIFIQIFEKAITNSKENIKFGTNLMLFIYYYNNNQTEKINHYLNQLENSIITDTQDVDVLESPIVTEFLTSIGAETNPDFTKLKEIIKKNSNKFSPGYIELLEKINIH
jgi:hypothetical protein